MDINSATFYDALHKSGFKPLVECLFGEDSNPHSLDSLFEDGTLFKDYLTRSPLLCRPAPPKNLLTMRENLEVIACPEKITYQGYVRTYSIPPLDLLRVLYARTSPMRRINLKSRKPVFEGPIDKFLETLKWQF